MSEGKDMCNLIFNPIIGSPGDRLHIAVLAGSMETGTWRHKLFSDLAALERLVVDALEPTPFQLGMWRHELSRGKAVQFGCTGVTPLVSEAAIEKLLT